MGYGGKGGRRGAGRADYTETVSSHLQQQLHMEKTQLHSVVDKLRQETEKVLGEWILLQHYLGQLKVIFEEEEKHIRDFQTHGQQVGTSRCLLVRTCTISSCYLSLFAHQS